MVTRVLSGLVLASFLSVSSVFAGDLSVVPSKINQSSKVQSDPAKLAECLAVVVLHERPSTRNVYRKGDSIFELGLVKTINANQCVKLRQGDLIADNGDIQRWEGNGETSSLAALAKKKQSQA